MNTREIGGYIELDSYSLPMLHEPAIALNCGRNALAYLVKAHNIKSIYLPLFICDSVINVCKREQVNVSFYHIDLHFKPVIDFELHGNDWLYIVNYYGQLTNEAIQKYANQCKNIIVDNAHSYFQLPVHGVDTLYTCRKYFGVADGAFLYTNQKLNIELPLDESFERMHFLLGRYERTASEFYSEYVQNNHLFANEPIKRMSKLTNNLLHAIDYKTVLEKRKNNFNYLHDHLKDINQLRITQTSTFMYPLMVDNGDAIRKQLQGEKIYIPTLWPSVFDMCKEYDVEYQMVKNILPLPIDQRYDSISLSILIEKLSLSRLENSVYF